MHDFLANSIRGKRTSKLRTGDRPLNINAQSPPRATSHITNVFKRGTDWSTTHRLHGDFTAHALMHVCMHMVRVRKVGTPIILLALGPLKEGQKKMTTKIQSTSLLKKEHHHRQSIIDPCACVIVGFSARGIASRDWGSRRYGSVKPACRSASCPIRAHGDQPIPHINEGSQYFKNPTLMDLICITQATGTINVTDQPWINPRSRLGFGVEVKWRVEG